MHFSNKMYILLTVNSVQRGKHVNTCNFVLYNIIIILIIYSIQCVLHIFIRKLIIFLSTFKKTYTYWFIRKIIAQINAPICVYIVIKKLNKAYFKISYYITMKPKN